MKEFPLDMPERNVVRRVSESISALVDSCPVASSQLDYLVRTEIERQQKEGNPNPNTIMIVKRAIEALHAGSFRYRIVSDAAIKPLQYCTDNYSDMLNVLAVLQAENKDTEYMCLTWSEKQNEYIKA